MATITSELTLADLIEQFGPLPIARIRTNPPPGSATEQDVIDIDLHEDRLYELIDGVLVEKAMGLYESFLAILIGRLLGNFVDEHHLGIVVGEAGMMKILPDQVRIPDVAFISWDRLPDKKVPREPVPELAPDLAVEVISKGNTAKEMDRKLNDYFAASVRLVWYVYPKSSTVEVYTSPTDSRELALGDTLDGGAVLPGFELPMKRLLDESRTQKG